MATAKKASPKDAIAMLKADHKRVSGLFEEFEKRQAATTSPFTRFSTVAGGAGSVGQARLELGQQAHGLVRTDRHELLRVQR
ncbi:MAG: hypothetical protein WKH97_04965 [Casimicrobiaceae bacterium]